MPQTIRQTPPHPRNASRHICRADGISLQVEVMAAASVTPGDFDDGESVILAQLVNGAGYVVYQSAGKLSSGLDLIECDSLAGAYDAFFLECRAVATDYLETDAEAIAAFEG